jgi:formylglycine-generating enzyme required for sulfatase activity
MTRLARRKADSLAIVLAANRSKLCGTTAACRIGSLLSAAAILILAASPAAAVTIATVPVGNPGNAADDTGYGSVGYNFRMGRTEVTNAQYVEFLNAVAASDPYQLFTEVSSGNSVYYGIVRDGSAGSYSYSVKPPVAGVGPEGSDYTYDNKPLTYVTLFSAMRFANWLQNGQGSGDTETGAYTLLGGTPTPSNSNVTRNAGARWVVPSENEWYKAAYYNPTSGTYANYATGQNSEPFDNPPSADNGNSANYGLATMAPYEFTDAGAYALSGSDYGTFDQNGNVLERLETLYVPQFPSNSTRLIRGGSAFESSGNFMVRTWRSPETPDSRFLAVGFRVALVPEPASNFLAAIAICGLRARQPRSSRRT